LRILYRGKIEEAVQVIKIKLETVVVSGFSSAWHRREEPKK